MPDTTARPGRRRVPPPPEIRAAIADTAAADRWAGTTLDQRRAALAPAAAGSDARWLRIAREKYPHLGEADLERSAKHLKSAYYARLQLASARARKAARGDA